MLQSLPEDDIFMHRNKTAAPFLGVCSPVQSQVRSHYWDQTMGHP